MKKHLISAILAISTLSGSGYVFAGTPPVENTQWRRVDNIARIGFDALQDIQLSRVALFNGQTQQAKNLLQDANKKINDDQTKWSSFIKKTKKTGIDSDDYVIINASIVVDESFQQSSIKSKAIHEANEKLKNGDKKGAIDTLKLAGIAVVENQMLLPLKHTRTDIRQAIQLVNEGKFYQANLVLLSAEQGVIIDTEAAYE